MSLVGRRLDATVYLNLLANCFGYTEKQGCGVMFLLWWPTSRSHRRRDICVQFLAGQCLDPTASLSLVCVDAGVGAK